MIVSINGFLLHSRKYKETSSIIYIFSPLKGIQSLIFKGKYTNKDKFKFSIFNEYQFSYNDKYKFPYLSKFEIISEYNFSKKYYLLGLYINELLYKTLKQGYDFEKVYENYKSFLQYLSRASSNSISLALLFERNLLDNLGYGLNMHNEKRVIDNEDYYYDFDYGFKKVDNPQNQNCIKGNYLKEFFLNTLQSKKDTIFLRNIVRQILNKIYPEMTLNGDKLF
tara:strand:- start:3025 stop:3693 length:669 start_codon:yes stop_codon:yes gene_type:complete